MYMDIDMYILNGHCTVLKSVEYCAMHDKYIKFDIS